MKKAYKIDVDLCDVYEVEIDENDYTSYNKQLDCEVYTAIHIRLNEDALFGDDEALLKDEQKRQFIFVDYPVSPITGHGLLVGTAEDGGAADVKSDINEFRTKIFFLPLSTPNREPVIRIIDL